MAVEGNYSTKIASLTTHWSPLISLRINFPGIRQQMQEKMDYEILGKACEEAISVRSARSR
jgi:hypothetical protein